jgi:hypothetical protein
MPPVPSNTDQPFSLGGISESSAADVPSTWKVIAAVTGATWYTYGIISTSLKIWSWLQTKIALHELNKLEKSSPSKNLARRSRIKVPPLSSCPQQIHVGAISRFFGSRGLMIGSKTLGTV